MAAKQPDSHTRELFEKLNDDVITLSWKWQILMSLFGTQERVDLLSATAPTFFEVCQTTFADDIFLALSRIADPPKSAGQDNLVITRLIDSVDQQLEPKFHQQLKTLVDLAILACAPFRKHRHKRLAHNDLRSKLQPTPNLLPNISVNDITKAIESLQNVLREFQVHYFDRETSYKVIENGGVKALVTHLQKAVETFKAEDERRLRGI